MYLISEVLKQTQANGFTAGNSQYIRHPRASSAQSQKGSADKHSPRIQSESVSVDNLVQVRILWRQVAAARELVLDRRATL